MDAKARSPRLRRRSFGLVSGASFAACVAVVALGVRSAWRVDQVRYAGGGGGAVWVESAAGGFSAMLTTDWPGSEFGFHWLRQPARASTGGFVRSAFDFGLARRTLTMFGDESHRAAEYHLIEATVPHWFVALSAGVAPALWARRHMRHRHRVSAGLCRGCGYDLRATPTACPECGRPVAASI